MDIYYELNPNIPGEVLRIEQDIPYVVKNHHGWEVQVCSVESETGTIYYHGQINLEDGTYTKDANNQEPIIINGVSYPLDANGEVFVPHGIKPTLEDAQAIILAEQMGVPIDPEVKAAVTEYLQRKIDVIAENVESRRL